MRPLAAGPGVALVLGFLLLACDSPGAEPAASPQPTAPTVPTGSAAPTPVLSAACQQLYACGPFWLEMASASGRDMGDAEAVLRGLRMDAERNDEGRCRDQLRLATDMAGLLEVPIPAECRPQ